MTVAVETRLKNKRIAIRMNNEIYQTNPMRLKSSLVFFLVSLLWIPVSARAQAWSGILDPSRAVDWTQAGFTITEPASQCTNQTGAYAPSGGDDAASINSLIAGCTGGGYILLSAGMFTLSSTGLKMYAVKNVVLRGAGPDKTKLVMTGSYGCFDGQDYICIYGNLYVGNNYYFGMHGDSRNWTAGYAKGDTVITLGSTTGLSVGQPILLDQDSDAYGFPTSGTGCSESGSTVTCNTTIPHNFSVNDTVYVGGTAWPTNNDCGQGTNAGYAGLWTVSNVPTSTSFQYTNTNAGLSTCTGGYASKDTGGIFVSGVQGQTIDQNSGYVGRSCPDAHNPTYPACHSGEVSQRNQTEVHVITAINNNQVTIMPPLMMNNWRSSQNPGVYWTGHYPADYAIGDGIESLTIDTSSGTKAFSAVTILNGYQCWIKNVRVISGDTSLLNIAESSNIDVLDSYFIGVRNGQSGTYGILDGDATSSNLIQNNILQHVPACMITNNNYGSVWAYNYCTDDAYAQGGALDEDFSSHGISGMMLWEGNDVPEASMDVIHGHASLNTMFRNRVLGNDVPAKSNYLYAHVFSAFNRGQNVVGDVLGTSGSQTQYIQPSGISQSKGYVYAVGLPDQNGSDVPTDPVALSTLLRWGNYDVVTGAVRWCGNSSDPGWTAICGGKSEIPTTGATFIDGNPVPATTTLPNSFYLSGQPSFWSTAFSTPPWPAIGPDVTGGNAPDGAGGHSYSIPAQLCYLNTHVDPAYQQTFTVTGATWSSGTATLTIGTNSIPVYSTIQVSGINPSGYNGTWQVTAQTSTTIKYAIVSNPGTYNSGGTLTYPNILLFNAANCYQTYGVPAPPTNLTATPH